jgi:hypothetical protein
MKYHPKLELLNEYENYVSVDSMLDHASIDSVVPGICIVEGCEYTADVEPDQEAGYCENCAMQTVQSCLVIAGVI